jgi:hypothetical protein
MIPLAPILSPFLVNAEAMRQQHPATFGRPEAEDLAALQVGDMVKVAIQDASLFLGATDCSERFWVEITKVNAPIFEGRIDNELFTKQLKFNDIIRFHLDNIYQIHVPLLQVGAEQVLASNIVQR